VTTTKQNKTKNPPKKPTINKKQEDGICYLRIANEQ
jgi:hypothetical protein